MKRNPHSEIRIIGGEARRRSIFFTEEEGLRPTPNRLRETLFNWLQGKIEGARCLDLFAGSGSLGLEALSRGASQVVFVDRSSLVMRSIEENLQRLGWLDRAIRLQTDILQSRVDWGVLPYDIVFLDPPYGKGLIELALKWLQQQKLITPNTFIYVEAEQSIKKMEFEGFSWYRKKQTKRIAYGLIYWEAV